MFIIRTAAAVSIVRHGCGLCASIGVSREVGKSTKPLHVIKSHLVTDYNAQPSPFLDVE